MCEIKFQISLKRQQKLSISTFPIMGTISWHRNQSSYPMGIKNTIYVEANVLGMYDKFQLIPLMVFEIFQKFTIHVAPATNETKRFGQKSYETWRTTT